MTHRKFATITLISKLRTLERLLILPQQLGQLPNEVEEEIILLDRNNFLGDLYEKRKALAALQSQSVRDILAEISSFCRTFHLEGFICIIWEVNFVEDLFRATQMIH